MTTIRIDEKHSHLLDRLYALKIMRGQKITKKDLVGQLIENALNTEDDKEKPVLCPLEEDPAWISLNKVYDLGIKDISENLKNKEVSICLCCLN